MGGSSLLLLIPVIVSAIVVIALINEESPLFNNTNAKANLYQCDPKSLDEVKLSFPVKEPTYIPEGYKLEVVDPYSFSLAERSEDSYSVNLYYAKEPMCHGINPSGFTEDVIVIGATNIQAEEVRSSLGSIDEYPLAYFTNKAEEYNSVIPDVANLTDKQESAIPHVRLIKVNDYFGIAREPMKAYTVVISHDKDGSIKDKVVEEQDVMRAGFLEFYHAKDKVLYTIDSILSVEEMIKIAENIP